MIISYDKKINRKVRVFISSTFSDMARERDIIVHSVFPRLRQEFTPQMIDINEVDLRWGIPEEDAESSKILEICIGEVLHCMPFFVGIVGQEYGSIASKDAIGSLPPAYRKAIGENLLGNLSITELEMRAGVFTPKNIEFSSFFLKNNIDESVIHPQLKQLIGNINSDYHTYTYDNLKSFEDQMYNSLKACISKLIPEKLGIPYEDKYYYSHLRILKNNVMHYIPDVLFVSSIEQRLSQQRKIYLKGKKGIGKSACVSWLAKREGVDNKGNVFFHFAATGNESLNIDNVFFRLRLYLQSIIKYTGEETNNRAIVTELLRILPSEYKLTLYFDALDQLNDVTAIYQFFALTNMNPNIYVVCSGTKDYRQIPKEQTVNLKPLTSEQIQKILKGTLKQFGKRLDKEMQRQIIHKSDCANPLFLQAFITQLRMYGTYDSFETFFSELINANTFGEIFNIVIKRLKNYFEETGIDKSIVDEALALLVYSNNGIRENELHEILEIMPITRSVFLSTIELFTIEENGLIRFNHDLIISNVKRILYESNIDYEKIIAEKLVVYFSKQPYNWRRYIEEPFQLCKLNKIDLLVESLVNKECFMYLRRNKYHSLIGYLSYLVDEQLTLSERLATELDVEQKVAAAEIFCQAGCHSAAIFIVNTLLDKGDKEHPELKIQLLDILARSQYKLGLNDYKTAITTYKTLLEHYKKLYPRDQIGYAARAYLLGVTYKTAGKLDLAVDILEKCAEVYSEYQIKTPTGAWIMDVYGESCYTSGNLKEALKIFNQNVLDCTDLYGEFAPELAWTYCYGWNTLYALGDRVTALEKTKEAYKIYYQIYMGRGTKVAWASLNVGIAYLVEGKLETAERFFKFSITENDIILKKEERPHRYSITAYANLANLYECKGDNENAVSTMKFALDESREKNGREHIYTANILLNIGILEHKPQRIEEAIKLYESQSIKTPDIFFARICLARILLLTKNKEKAISEIKECADEYLKKDRETELITYLILETLEKMCGDLSEDMMELLDSLYRFEDYKFYLTFNNNSNIIIIPPI